MELIVNLCPREEEYADYKVVDWLSGKDVTKQVYRIELLPGKEMKAYLYRLNSTGNKYITPGGEIARLGSFPVVKLYGA